VLAEEAPRSSAARALEDAMKRTSVRIGDVEVRLNALADDLAPLAKSGLFPLSRFALLTDERRSHGSGGERSRPVTLHAATASALRHAARAAADDRRARLTAASAQPAQTTPEVAQAAVAGRGREITLAQLRQLATRLSSELTYDYFGPERADENLSAVAT